MYIITSCTFELARLGINDSRCVHWPLGLLCLFCLPIPPNPLHGPVRVLLDAYVIRYPFLFSLAFSLVSPNVGLLNAFDRNRNVEP